MNRRRGIFVWLVGRRTRVGDCEGGGGGGGGGVGGGGGTGGGGSDRAL